MSNLANNPTNLIQQGLAAARVGDLDDARRMLREATQCMPGSVEAWLGLAGVVESLTEKEICFNQVLALDPDNEEAKVGLTLVQQKLAGQTTTPSQAKTSPAATEPNTDPIYCYRHSDIQTSLRCNRCNKPICPKCARRTPVGFRCPDCIREQENKFYSGSNLDYALAVVVALPLSFFAAGLFTFILGGFGFWVILLGFIVAPVVAGFIAEAVRWAVRKRRSRYLGRVTAACIILGAAPFLLFMLLSSNFYALLAPGIFVVLGATTALARLR